MPTIFTVLLVVLAVLAILDLIVGVANDAINFLNSALGSRVATFRTIVSVAAVGIMVGVLTSHGMMEVARTGVFHPQHFTFNEVMMLYAGVMFSMVILLNGFNKLGLPTSTTVSMIFGLLGAALGVSVFKLWYGNSAVGVSEMVNTAKALGMISAILVSVVLSFAAGSIVMYFSRLLFTFRYAQQFKRYGALWCGIAIVGIFYFAVFKGLKSSGMITPEIDAYVSDHIGLILLGCWLVAAGVLLLLQLCKVSILKVTILSGTFALALAFAGNDLVNFIGVPLAALDAYHIAAANGSADITMETLAEAQPTDFWFLLGAGVVMVLTLFFSRDAMRVSQTELTLASQQDEDNRFGSSLFSRLLVRSAVNLNNYYLRVMPNSLIDAINRRFIPLSAEERGTANYDKIRAVVNLACSAILICIGTSFQLPLSTTYVVFMVAMGASLADRAWGRDSAVYRITGVMVVVMGWFVTGIVATAVAFAVTLFLVWGGGWALAAMVLLSAALLCREFLVPHDKEDEPDMSNDPLVSADDTPSDVMLHCSQMVCNTMAQVSQVYNHTLVALFTENRRALREAVQQSEQMYQLANQRKYSIVGTLKQIAQHDIATGHFYVYVVDYLSEVTKALLHCTRPAYEHINNNHRGLTGPQIMALKSLNDDVDDVFARIGDAIKRDDFSSLDDVMVMRDNLFDHIAHIVDEQITRLQQPNGDNPRSCLLFLNLLNETKTMVLQARNLFKAQAYFLRSVES